MPDLSIQAITVQANALKGMWRTRNTRIKTWYQQLLQTDDLAQEGLESFTSNNPRTTFNLALHLLTPKTMPVRIPIEPLQYSEVPQSSEVERALRIMWQRVDRSWRRRGQGRWLRSLNSQALATGWFAVYANIDPKANADGTDECVAEIWPGPEVYPQFDSNGLSECVHSYTITKRELTKKIQDLGWTDPKLTGTTVVVDDFWFIGDDDGKVYNCVIIRGQFVKPPQADPVFDRIPVFCSPVGGLPDRGSIMNDQSWKEHVGEAMVATNEFVQRNYNRQMTFLQQLLRDTAQPVSFEKSTGAQIVPDPNQLYKRGAHFRMGLQEDLGYLAKPAVPVDFRTQLFDTDSMLQRGSLPYIMFGNMQSQVTGYLISQVAASAQQHLAPYGEGTQFVVSDISNWWLFLIENTSLRPYGLKVPKLPPGVEVEAELNISVPGDITQRATVARMLNPTFTLSQAIIMDLMFPEILDPTREMSRVRTEAANQHPVAIQINLIHAYNEQADILQQEGDSAGAALFRNAALLIAQQIQQSAQNPQAGATAPQAPSTPQSVLPAEALQGGLGSNGGLG